MGINLDVPFMPLDYVYCWRLITPPSFPGRKNSPITSFVSSFISPSHPSHRLTVSLSPISSLYLSKTSSSHSFTKPISMGTRGYVFIRCRGRYFVYYNHWDSYPEGLGEAIIAKIPTDPEKYHGTY